MRRRRLRLLARANGIALDDPRLMQAARATGADVPVCLDPRPRRMRGIGDILSEPLDLPRLPAVLVNPGVAVPTRDVFAALTFPTGGGAAPAGPLRHRRQRSSIRLPMVATTWRDRRSRFEPVIADVLAVLRKLPGCRLARMSGSGATCFGLFDSTRTAAAAGRTLRVGYPGWWVRSTVLGDSQP